MNNSTQVGCTNCTELSEFPLALIVSLSFIMVLIIVISILGNLVVCVIVYRKAAMRSAINLLLANMALCNIILATICMSFTMATLFVVDSMDSEVACRIIMYIHHVLVCESVSILLTISVDRYLIIVCRKDKLTPYRAKVLIIGTWCFAAAFALPPSLGWGNYSIAIGQVLCMIEKSQELDNITYLFIFCIVVYFLPMLIMAYSFLCIINTVRKNSLRVQSMPGGNDSIMQCNKMGLASMISLPQRVNVDMSFKTRAFKTILILFITFLLCWAPYAIHLLLWNFVDSSRVTGILLLWIAYMNCAVNPVIYCWRIKKFREACRQFLPKVFKLLPQLPEKTRRRIKPSSVYEISSDIGDNQTSI